MAATALLPWWSYHDHDHDVWLLLLLLLAVMLLLPVLHGTKFVLHVRAMPVHVWPQAIAHSYVVCYPTTPTLKDKPDSKSSAADSRSMQLLRNNCPTAVTANANKRLQCHCSAGFSGLGWLASSCHVLAPSTQKYPNWRVMFIFLELSHVASRLHRSQHSELHWLSVLLPDTSQLLWSEVVFGPRHNAVCPGNQCCSNYGCCEDSKNHCAGNNC